MENVILTSDLTKTYQHKHAVDSFNFAVPFGSIYGIVGKNGSGKTTLIRLLTGLIFPSRGTYSLFNATNGRENTINRRKVAAIVENPAIFPQMTALENMKMQALVLGIKSDQINDLLKIVKLDQTGKKKAKDFSLGMRQRLAIALALLGNPELLILDEPTNGLDPQGIVEIRELLISLSKEKKVTILISSHILSEMQKLATHYAFVDEGRLLECLSAEDLEEKARKNIVMFLSTRNNLEVVLTKHNITDYDLNEHNRLIINGTIDITEFIYDLRMNNIKVLHIRENDSNVESYFLSLIGGHHA